MLPKEWPVAEEEIRGSPQSPSQPHQEPEEPAADPGPDDATGPTGSGARPALTAKFTVEPIAFSREFLADAAAAKQKYMNKFVLITGTVTFAGEEDARLKIKMEGDRADTESDPVSIVCNFVSELKDDVAKVKVGDKVTIRGLVSGSSESRVNIIICKLAE